MSLEKYSIQKVGDRVIDLVGDLYMIQRAAIELFNTDPSDKEVAAQNLDERVDVFDRNVAALKNALLTLGKVASGTEQEGEDIEIDVIPDANGIRF